MRVKWIIAKGLRSILNPPAIRNSIIDESSKVCSGSQVNNSVILKNSYVGHNCFLLNVSIGAYCSIADNCRLGGAEHPLSFVSTSPVFNSGKNVLKKNLATLELPPTKKISIGADVWIGSNAIIKSGVDIGVGSVIGAGSVVTHDVPAYEIWAGNPAKKIGARFNDNIAKELLQSEWWMYDEKTLKEFADTIDNVEVFLRKIRKNRSV